MSWVGLLPSAHSAILGTLGESVELRSSDGSSTASVKAIYTAHAVVEEVHGAEHVYRQHVLTLQVSAQPAWMARGVSFTLLDRTPALVLEAVEGTPDGQGLISWTAVKP